MKLKLPTKDLRDALAKLAHLPGAAGALPYTQAVKFESGMDGLSLTRFSSEAKISITLDTAEIEDAEGSFSVDHPALTALVSRLPDKVTGLSCDQAKVHFVSGKAKAALAIFTGDFAKDPPQGEMETESIKLPITLLHEMLEIPSKARSSDGVRVTWNGVTLRMMYGKLYAIGTDGKRCHISIQDYNLPVDCIIPSDGLDAILKATAGEEGACTLSIGESTAAVIGSNVEVVVSLMAEKLANISQLLEQSSSSIKSKIEISRDELASALRTCAAIGEGTARLVRFTVSQENLLIEADNLRDSQISMKLDCKASAASTFGGPATQMAEALDVMKPDDKGMIIIDQHEPSLLIRQPDRVAFIALAKA